MCYAICDLSETQAHLVHMDKSGQVCSVGTMGEREFDFASPFFYILLWSHHLVAIRSTVCPARDVIPILSLR